MRSHYAFVAFMVFLAGFGIYQTVYFGWASLHSYSVINSLRQWQESPSEHNYGDYLKTKKKAQLVTAYHPDNAEYWDLRAQVGEWGYVFGYEGSVNALLEVKNHYLRATSLRPFWPDTWASLIKLKWRLQEFDTEMLHYFERATSLGPQKAKVHLTVVELGLVLYTVNHPLSSKISTEFQNRLALGLRNRSTRAAVKNLIHAHGLSATVCSWLKHEESSIRKLINKCK